MSKRIFLAAIIFLFLITGFILWKRQRIKKDEIHYHAGFQVYIDEELQDFSQTKYMSVKLCGEDEKEHKQDEQLEKAHLHDNIGDVVHVEAEEVKWKDLFKNIKFNIDRSKPIEGFVNGKKVSDILAYPIKTYDSLVLLIGEYPNSSDYVKQGVKKEWIKEIERKSESC